MKPVVYAIAAAGTGGHVLPALAVADELVRQGSSKQDFVFFGGDRMAPEAVPAAGYELVQFHVSGFRRRVTLQNVRVPAQVMRAQRRMVEVIGSRNIDVVLAMGGYITGPAALAARRTGKPLVLHEQNAVPGLANRWAARFATQVLVAFPAAAEALTGAEVVGNPIRRSLVGPLPEMAAARHRYGLAPHVPVVGVMGGSLGADALNHGAADLARKSPGYQILHLAGRRQSERWQEASAAVASWAVVPFEEQMEFFYAAADLVVARAGALTVSELAATGTPSILVPYPHGTGGHQEKNAAQLVGVGGAEILSQYDLAMLPLRVEAALTESSLAHRAAAAATVGLPGAAAAVAGRLQELAHV